MLRRYTELSHAIVKGPSAQRGGKIQLAMHFSLLAQRLPLGYHATMHPQPLICVRNVEASSRWYQRLLGCQSGHGGSQYEQLVANGQLLMQLHSWQVEHHHGKIGDPNLAHGNGVLLWFEIEDFDAAVARAEELRAPIVQPRHRNPPQGDGGPNHWEIWLRDPDGYTVVLASPYGTADGTWRPEPGGPFRGR